MSLPYLGNDLYDSFSGYNSPVCFNIHENGFTMFFAKKALLLDKPNKMSCLMNVNFR